MFCERTDPVIQHSPPQTWARAIFIHFRCANGPTPGWQANLSESLCPGGTESSQPLAAGPAPLPTPWVGGSRGAPRGWGPGCSQTLPPGELKSEAVHGEQGQDSRGLGEGSPPTRAWGRTPRHPTDSGPPPQLCLGRGASYGQRPTAGLPLC